ncbi:homeobox protein Wariai-like isoform X2 [Littorina saxatilis]
MQHDKEEKKALSQLFAETALGENPDLEKIDSLLKSAAFLRVPVDHVCHHLHFNALEAACYQGNVDLVQMLLNHGADIQGTTRNSKSCYWQPLHLACQSSAPTSAVLKVVKLLVEGGASVLEPDGSDVLPLMHAVDSNHADVVEFLLTQGADPNEWFYGTPPLILACAGDDTKIHPCITDLLLKAGTDPNIPNSNHNCVKQAFFHLSVEKLLLLFAYKARLGVGVITLSDIKSLMEAVLRKAGRSDATPKDKYFVILELLLAAGLEFSTNDRKWVEERLVTLEYGRNLAWRSELIEETLKLFNSCVFCPQRLTSLCRLRIRPCILPDIDANLGRLPVPASVQDFLRFGDIAVRSVFNAGVAVVEL